MIIKTSELEGAALDWAVANAVGELESLPDGALIAGGGWYSPSSSWSIGGPLIDKMKIEIAPCGPNEWRAMRAASLRLGDVVFGPTPLIAAMRAIVAAELGDEVDVPEELV